MKGVFWGVGRGAKKRECGVSVGLQGDRAMVGKRAGGVAFPENSSIAAFLRTGERGFLSKGLQRTCLEINWNKLEQW